MTIRVFIGCAPNGEDAESLLVLEHSLRKHASEPIELVYMKHERGGFWSGWASERWATPFSGFRWGIPAYCNFEGRALYMDSDMIVLADVAELWRTEFEPGKIVVANGSWRFCVSLWDCAAAREFFPPIEHLRKQPAAHSAMVSYFRRRPDLIQAFERGWNYCDNEDYAPLSSAKILHYTAMDTQPQLRYALPRLAAAGRSHWFSGQVRKHPRPEIETLFDELLAEAIAAGGRVEDYVPAEPFGMFRLTNLQNYRGHK
jgi:hypothetical protein